jgi:hypothetical protein
VTDDAAVLIADEGTVRTERLQPGHDLAYTLSDRHCAGVISEESHTRCGANETPYCPEHTSRWPCARCTGGCEKPIDACDEDHAVYLAAFAPATVKVGVTRAWRLETRLREQGADRAAHIRTVDDGRIARQIEADIAASLTDRVRVAEKIAGMADTVDTDQWDAICGEYDPIDRFSFEYGLALDERPIAETLATGTVRGVKGRVLVLDRGGSTYAVDLRDLVGFEITSGTTDRALQSSLGSFG